MSPRRAAVHSHFAEERQLASGLYGALVVPADPLGVLELAGIRVRPAPGRPPSPKP